MEPYIGESYGAISFLAQRAKEFGAVSSGRKDEEWSGGMEHGLDSSYDSSRQVARTI
jgi:hypothetical protein